MQRELQYPQTITMREWSWQHQHLVEWNLASHQKKAIQSLKCANCNSEFYTSSWPESLLSKQPCTIVPIADGCLLW
jgi:hypothetical protein